MDKYIIGLNAYHPDSSACLFKNGTLICAIEEERFTRVKHFSGFPFNAILNCLKFANIEIKDISAIAVNKNTKSNLFHKGIFFLKEKYKKSNFLKISNSINFNKRLNHDFKRHFNLSIKNKIYNVDHHICHILNSYYSSSFKESNVLSVDGFGDFASINFGFISEKVLKIHKKTLFPHSLGIFYQAITQLLGFRDYGEEYKVMGMSAYGKHYLKIFDKIISYNEKNFIKLNLNYFDFINKEIVQINTDGSPNIPNLFSKKMEEDLIYQRLKNQDLTDLHFDIAFSLQKKYEEILIKIINEIQTSNLSNNLCISGGCANNSLANGKILDKNKNLNFSYASGDNGGAIGACLYYLRKNNIPILREPIISPYQGIMHLNDDIDNIIDKNKYKIRKIDKEEELINLITNDLKQNKVVALCRGRSEFGPRALGNRSILANPSKPNIKDILNSKIKKREKFRPFAPSVLDYKQDEYFKFSKNIPYMTEVIKANKNTKEKIHGAVHVDGTCRVQTVSKNINDFYYKIIENFYHKTDIPVLLNTSFNISEPIVESPKDAYECFDNSEIDTLVINNHYIYRNDLSSS